jgi:hypothetical protein
MEEGFMVTRFRMLRLLAAGLLLSAALSSAHAEVPRKREKDAPNHPGKPIPIIYQVADLVIPRDTFTVPRAEGSRQDTKPAPTLEAQLIQLVTQSIEPDSWREMGGPGKIEYYPIGQCLVIIQKPEVQERIADLLEALRRSQDVEVALEIRFLGLPDSVLERLDLKGAAPSQAPCLRCLNDAELRQLVAVVQGCAQANIMQAPRMVLYNGQDARFDVRQEELVETGTTGAEPKREVVKTGLMLAARPVVSVDRRSVRVHFMVEESELIPQHQTEGAFPVVLPASVNVQRIDKHVTIPDGKTALLYGWRRKAKPVEKERIPILSYIPYLTELFCGAGLPSEGENVLIALTPRMLVSEEKEERAVPSPPRCAGKAEVAELLANYKKACREGRLAEARCFAERALSLDPSCFCDSCPR